MRGHRTHYEGDNGMLFASLLDLTGSVFMVIWVEA